MDGRSIKTQATIRALRPALRVKAVRGSLAAAAPIIGGYLTVAAPFRQSCKFSEAATFFGGPAAQSSLHGCSVGRKILALLSTV